MPRLLAACAALAALPFVSWAGDPPTKTIIRFNVAPAAAPKAALKYLLLPDLKEMEPGNAAQGWMKCFFEQQNFFFSKDSVANREKWQTMPLKDLPVEKLRDYGGAALRQADRAARMDRVDWQLLAELKKDGVHTLLPEIQSMRMLAAALKVRFRAEVAERRFDDATRTAKTMFALARHMDEGPTLIVGLVGIAIASLTVGPLEEMIDQPGCPNLYWALTDLPEPFISLRKPAQGERCWTFKDFQDFDVPTPISDAQAEVALARFEKFVQKLTEEHKKDVRAWIGKRARDEAHLKAARARLVDSGKSARAVARMPAVQVMLLDQTRELEERHDAALKWLSVPYWKAQAAGAGSTPTRQEKEWLLTDLVPAVSKVHRAQARLQQRLALLRVVEALRLHAAAHGGKLPARLADVEVLLPVDPFTGQPFIYKVDGKKAIIQGTPPRGDEKVALYNVQIELTIRK
jgi:hypothetical protein